ncbi:MAG: xyloglucanase [Fimbriimonadaceae bacterium]|nr:xyloglucanase [Fimbriimonadaceae bacterium]
MNRTIRPLLLALAASGSSQGPAPYQWRNVEIVGGGFVTGIEFHPSKKDLVYARTDIGGAYRLDPKSKRWIPLNDWVAQPDWNLYGVESIGLDPSDPNRLYLALGTYTNEWAGPGEIVRSRDQGRTFQRTDLPFKMGGNMDGRSIGERLAVDPQNGETVLFGTRKDGLWRSRDAGATWSRVPTFPEAGIANGAGLGIVLYGPKPAFGPTPILVGAAIEGTSLYRSDDGGESWRPIPGQPLGLVPHHAVWSKDGWLVVAYSDRVGPNGVSNGAVWSHDLATGKWGDISPVRPGEGDRFGYAGVTVDPNDPDVILVSTLDRWAKGDDVFRTRDGGQTWVSLAAKSVMDSSGAPYLTWGGETAKFGWWIGDVAMDPFRPDRALFVTGATIWGTEDLAKADRGEPTVWTVRAQGLEETAVIDLVSPPQGPPLISGLGDIGGFTHERLDRTPPKGMTTNPMLGNTDSLDFAERKPAWIVRVGRAGSDRRRGGYSSDGGRTWKPFATEPGGNAQGGTVAIAADASVVLWCPQGHSPYRSADLGATWQPCEGGPMGLSVIADRSSPNRFYGYRAATRSVYASKDGGLSFTEGATDLPRGRDRIRAHPTRSGELWLATDSGLSRSTDGGRTFAPVGPVTSAVAMGFGKPAPGSRRPTLFLAGNVRGASGLFRSVDDGRSWTRIDDARHRFGTVGTVIGDPRVFGRVYLGTNGRGVLVGEPAAP